MDETYANLAAAAAEGIKTRGTTSTDTQAAGIKALTYALLDVADAIRSHAR
jgi:hypothetical protein